jgi:hypothetical protein
MLAEASLGHGNPGPVSFRKPTTITLAWVTGRLGPERPQVVRSARSED